MSRIGKYLATGSDDHMILIWERKDGTMQAQFGQDPEDNLENWTIFKSLRGHLADVNSLSW